MAAQTLKRTQELFFGQRFLERIGLRGDLESSDRPDLLLRREDGSLLGIEVTERVTQLREQEKLQWRTLSLAQRKYEEAFSPLELVTVMFNSTCPLTKRAVPVVADSLMNLVAAHCPPIGQHTYFEWSWERRSIFRRELYYLSIRNSVAVERGAWAPLGATFIPPLLAQEVQHAVEVKTQKVLAYRMRCDEIWLLIVLDGGSLSSMFDVRLDSLESVGKGSFDRVFLFYDREAVFEISRHR